MRLSSPVKRRAFLKFRQFTVGYLKIKILLGFCIVFALLLFVARISSFIRWKNHRNFIVPSGFQRMGYTLLINTWKRNYLLKKSISHYAACPRLDSIHIVWMFGKVLQIQWLDSYLECTGWIRQGNMNHYVYGGWWSIWWTGTYSMVLSKAAFFHKKYLELYTNEMPAAIKQYIAHNRNCEDIAISFLVANATGAPPIWVKGKISEIGSTGINSMGGHSHKRTQCVNRFVAEFGKMPLVSTSMKVVYSRTTWFW